MSPLLKRKNASEEKKLLTRYCLISGAVACAVMLFVYLCHGNTLTFGDNTVLRMDLYHQYGPLYAELYDRIVNGYSLVYSWTSGLGGAFLGNLFNYCCSPFAMIILLLGHQNMPEAIALMILMKAVLASACFTYYINKSSGTVNQMSIGFGLLYTFSGYFVAYSWNIMWLDAMAVFPLVILGVEKIIQKNKPSLYIFAMTYTMITNYYMAYMVCLLSVLWFLFYYLSRYELTAPMFRAPKEAPAGESPVWEVPAASAPEEAPAAMTEDGFEVIAQEDIPYGFAVRGEPQPGEPLPAEDKSPAAEMPLAVAESATVVTETPAEEGAPAVETADANAVAEVPDAFSAVSGEVPAPAEETPVSEAFDLTPVPEEPAFAPAPVTPAPETPVPAAPEAPAKKRFFSRKADKADPSEKGDGKTKGWLLALDAAIMVLVEFLLVYGVVQYAPNRSALLLFLPLFLAMFILVERKRLVALWKKLRDSRFWITGWSFALSSGLSFLLSAFALLPVYYCLQTSSATGNSFPGSFISYFNLFDFVANHLPGLTTTIRSSGDIVLPNIYCGLICVMLLPLFFFSKRVSGRKKVAAALLVGFFWISFSNNYFNYVWHGMHMPNDLPFRYSFAYSFLLLVLCYQVFRHLDEFSTRAYVGVGVSVIAFAILLDDLTSPNVVKRTVIMSVIFAVVYVIFFGLLKSKRFQRDAILSLLIIGLVTEICVADVTNFVMQQPKSYYVTDYPEYQSISGSVESGDDSLFFRTELSDLRTRMDPCWYGYHGVSTFSSMAYEHVAKLMEYLGMFGNNINSYTYYPQTPLFNSMFALKYIYDNAKLIDENDFYQQKAENDTFTAYEYQYVLPLAFAVSERITDWSLDLGDPFLVQNDMMEKAAGVADILIPAEVSDVAFDNIVDNVEVSYINNMSSFNISKESSGSDGRFTAYIDVEEEGHFYLYAGGTHVDGISVSSDSFNYTYSSAASQAFTLDIGSHAAGDRISIVFTLNEHDDAAVDFSLVRIDKDKFEQAYKNLQSYGALQLDSFDETSLSGTVNVKGQDKLLYTSIPYDESWEVYIDGNYVGYDSEDIVKIGDALLGVRIPAGQHTVALRYKARGLSTGMKLTALGVMIVALMLVWKFWLAEPFLKKHPIRLLQHPDWEKE